MTIEPFAYPKKPLVRKHGPAGYKNYKEYKPWLRDEFCFRCIYCLERELWYPSGAAAFSVDHVIPQSVDSTLICVYENLVYACSRCNSWRQDESVLDPAKVAFADHLRIEADGSITALSLEGQDLVDLLDLASPSAIRLRKKYLRILRRFLETPKTGDSNWIFSMPLDTHRICPTFWRAGHRREMRK